jgi:hypothetical protein
LSVNISRVVSIGMLLLAVALGGAWWLQWQAAAELRAELALLRNENNELARLRAENRRLRAAQVSEAELSALRSDHAAVARLRAEIEKLRDDVDRRARAVGQQDAPIPAREWKNAGRATPAAAVETLLWMASRHATDELAATLSIDPQVRPMVDQFFAALPEAVRARYGSLERMIVDFVTRDLPLAAMQTIAERPSDADHTLLVVRLQGEAGNSRDMSVPLVRQADGWRPAVQPDLVQRIANEVGRQIGATDKGG